MPVGRLASQEVIRDHRQQRGIFRAGPLRGHSDAPHLYPRADWHVMLACTRDSSSRRNRHACLSTSVTLPQSHHRPANVGICVRVYLSRVEKETTSNEESLVCLWANVLGGIGFSLDIARSTPPRLARFAPCARSHVYLQLSRTSIETTSHRLRRQ